MLMNVRICTIYTVWKFHDFPIIQILREINLGESRGPKTAVLGWLDLGGF